MEVYTDYVKRVDSQKAITCILAYILRRSGKVFTHLCDVLFWSLMVTVLDIDHTIAVKVLGVIYLCMCNILLSFDALIFQVIIRKKNWLIELRKFEVITLACIVIVQTLLLLPVLCNLKSFLGLIAYKIVSNIIYSKLYFFFVDAFNATDTNVVRSKLVGCLYTGCKLTHFLLLCLLVFIICPFIWKCKYINYMHPNYGVVQYNAIKLDGNDYRKCDTLEYLRKTLHVQLENSPFRSNLCSAIPGEFVTFSCNITRNNATLYSNAVFVWMKAGKNIKTNRRQKVTNQQIYDYSSRKTSWISNLTIYHVKKVDYNTYKCFIKLDIRKRRCKRPSFFHILNKSNVCIHKTKEVVTSSKEISLVEYKGYQHTIRAPLGYLLKLQNVFPFRVKENVSDIIFRTDRYFINLPFEGCYTSVRHFYNLEDAKPDQFSETMFCLSKMFGLHYMQTKFDTDVTIVHPNSILILPARHLYSPFESAMFLDWYFSFLVTNTSFVPSFKENSFLINTAEELFYKSMELAEKVVLLYLILVIIISVYVEWKCYNYFRSSIRKYGEFESCGRKNIASATHDIFLSFCEQSQCDQTFVVDKLLPYLEHEHHYKIKACHTINAGAHSLEQHSEEIQKCRKVLIVWSKDYAEDIYCRSILRAVILGLHCNGILKLEDIITIRFLSHPLSSRYAFFFEDGSVDVPDDTENNLDTIDDCIRASFAKNQSTLDNIRSSFIFRLVSFVLSMFINCVYCTGKVKYIAAILVPVVVAITIWLLQH